MGEPMDYHYDDDGLKEPSAIQVVAVPGCLFNNVQVCLSTRGKGNLQKLRVMAARFRQWYIEQERKGNVIIPSSIGRPVTFN